MILLSGTVGRISPITERFRHKSACNSAELLASLVEHPGPADYRVGANFQVQQRSDIAAMGMSGCARRGL